MKRRQVLASRLVLTKIDLVLNLKVAKARGLVVPPAIMARADHVVQ